MDLNCFIFQSFGKLRYDPPEYENDNQDFKVGTFIHLLSNFFYFIFI